MKEKQKNLNLVEIIICLLFLILLYFALFINQRFDDITFEQLLYNNLNTNRMAI